MNSTTLEEVGFLPLVMIGLLQGMTPLAANAAELPVSYENRAAIETEIHELIAQNQDATPFVSVIVFDNTQDICFVIYGAGSFRALL